jgi:hypothetical protein
MEALPYQCVAAAGFLVCLTTLYGESSCLPSRNVFCVMTKIPTEILGVELPLVAWSAPWYGVSASVLPTSPRIVFYGGIIHTVALAHATLTLYNSVREVDYVDRVLLAIDAVLLSGTAVRMSERGRLTEVAAVLCAVLFFWLTALSRHVAAQREEREISRAARERRKAKATRRASGVRKRRPREAPGDLAETTFLR